MIRLGTWGRRSAAPSDNLARAAETAATLTVGGGGGVIVAPGVRVPSLRSPDAVLQAVGVHYAIRHATSLIAIKSSGRVELGPCRIAGRIVSFTYWFPHLGVAVDVGELMETEITAKLEWCRDRGILYFPPGTTLDVIRDTVRKRRESRAAA